MGRVAGRCRTPPPCWLPPGLRRRDDRRCAWRVGNRVSAPLASARRPSKCGTCRKSRLRLARRLAGRRDPTASMPDQPLQGLPPASACDPVRRASLPQKPGSNARPNRTNPEPPPALPTGRRYPLSPPALRQKCTPATFARRDRTNPAPAPALVRRPPEVHLQPPLPTDQPRPRSPGSKAPPPNTPTLPPSSGRQTSSGGELAAGQEGVRASDRHWSESRCPPRPPLFAQPGRMRPDAAPAKRFAPHPAPSYAGPVRRDRRKAPPSWNQERSPP